MTKRMMVTGTSKIKQKIDLKVVSMEFAESLKLLNLQSHVQCHTCRLIWNIPQCQSALGFWNVEQWIWWTIPVFSVFNSDFQHPQKFAWIKIHMQGQNVSEPWKISKHDRQFPQQWKIYMLKVLDNRPTLLSWSKWTAFYLPCVSLNNYCSEIINGTPIQ